MMQSLTMKNTEPCTACAVLFYISRKVSGHGAGIAYGSGRALVG